MLYINIRVPVGNTDAAGATTVCTELLAGERPGELALVSDRVWISDDTGQDLVLVKGDPHDDDAMAWVRAKYGSIVGVQITGRVADAGDDPAAPSV
jgi:hypothetical protein